MHWRFTVIAFLVVFSLKGSTEPDSLAIQTYPEKMLFNSLLRFSQQTIDIPIDDRNSLFFCKSNISVGGRLQYKNIGLALTVPAASVFTTKHTDTKIIGAGLNMITNGFILEGNARYLQGLSQNQAIYRADGKLFEGRLRVIIPLQAKKYSLKSPYRLLNRQVESKGSPLVSFGVSHRYMTATEHLIVETGSPDIIRAHSMTNFASVGYGYTFTQGNFFMNVQAIGGVSKDFTHILSENQVKKRFWSPFYPTADFRSALGFQNDNFGWSVHCSWQPDIKPLNTQAVVIDNFILECLVGFRLEPIKPMIKANDIIDRLF